MARYTAATQACGNLPDGPAFDQAVAFADKCDNELRALEAWIPNPPRTFSDIALRAEIAFYHADRDFDANDRMEWLDDAPTTTVHLRHA